MRFICAGQRNSDLDPGLLARNSCPTTLTIYREWKGQNPRMRCKSNTHGARTVLDSLHFEIVVLQISAFRETGTEGETFRTLTSPDCHRYLFQAVAPSGRLTHYTRSRFGITGQWLQKV